MIFQPKHVEQIYAGEKTQTRRASPRYKIGRTYAVQAGRGNLADPRGRIRILKKIWETYQCQISPEDALAEGGYTPKEYEQLYLELNQPWTIRYAYTFEVKRFR